MQSLLFHTPFPSSFRLWLVQPVPCFIAGSHVHIAHQLQFVHLCASSTHHGLFSITPRSSACAFLFFLFLPVVSNGDNKYLTASRGRQKGHQSGVGSEESYPLSSLPPAGLLGHYKVSQSTSHLQPWPSESICTRSYDIGRTWTNMSAPYPW